MYSEYFNYRQIKVINKIGNIYCPGYETLPSFEDLGVVELIDQVVAELPPADRNDLKLLMTILSFLPLSILKVFIFLVESSTKWPQFLKPIANLFLLIRFGLRGIVFSLYYSGLKGSQWTGPAPTEIIGFKPTIVALDHIN